MADAADPSPPPAFQLPTDRRWTQVDGQNMLAAYRASGLSVCAFIKQHRLSSQRFYYWRDKVETSGDLSDAADDESIATIPQFRRLRVLQEAGDETTGVVDIPIQIRVGSVRIKVSSTIHERVLTKFMNAALVAQRGQHAAT